ncbi:hypothetical protein KIPB_005474, partial [Kipferlia bialata]
GKSRM